MKQLTILGSTGSIGTQALEVAAANPEMIRVRVLAAHHQADLLYEQICRFCPDFAVMTDPQAARTLQHRLGRRCEILSGSDGLLAAASYGSSTMVLGAMVGYAGLAPTLAAIKNGKDIALANKETLVAAGHLVMEAARQHHVQILPVDSEHSAIFQSLRSGRRSEVRRLILTASGGPFRGRTRKQLEQVTLEECLHHPNWKMGPKVTVDSSTLANKGLEVIEAHWLFDMPYDQIDVVIHPQSLIHSLVEFCDGAVIAQLGLADMRLPIQYAFSYPARYDCAFGHLDLIQAGTMTFEAPDLNAFPALGLAIACGRAGGTAPCIFNAANEECVHAFLAGTIRYLDIAAVIARVLDSCQPLPHPDLETIMDTDQKARHLTQAIIAAL